MRWWDGERVQFSARFFRFEEARQWAIDGIPASFAVCAVVTLNRLDAVDAILISPGLRK